MKPTIKRKIMKGYNNDGYLSKQYCYIAHNKEKKGYEPALIIKRLILINKIDVLDYLQTGHFIVKRFNDKMLMLNSFSIKLKTLDLINDWIKKQ